MTEQYNNTKRPIHDLARFSYLQELVTHKRVLLVEGDIQLARFISDARARYVCAISDQPLYDPASGTQGTIDVQQMNPQNMEFRESSFDLVILPDVNRLGRPEVVLAECRRVLDRSGHVIAASPYQECVQRLGSDPEQAPVDYYDFYDQLSEHFPIVQIVAQAPFVGYTMSDLSSDDQEPSIAFDQSLGSEEGEAPEWFLAICGEREAHLDALAVVQIPILEAGIGRAKLAEVFSARDSAQSLQGELTELQQAYQQLNQDLSEARSRSGEMDRLADQKQQLERELQEVNKAAARVSELEKEMEQARLELGNRGVRIGTLEQDLENEKLDAEAARERGVKLAKELDNERKAIQAKQLEEEYQKRTASMELNTQLHEAELKLNQANARAQAAEAAHDSIIDRMRGDAEEIDRLRDTADKLKNKADKYYKREKELQDELSKARPKIEELHRELDKARPRIEELHTANELLGQRESSLLESLNDVQAKLEAAEKQANNADKFNAERKELEEEIASLEEQLRRVGKARRDAEDEIERREAIIRDLVVKLENKEQESKGSGGRVDELQKELTEAASSIDNLQQKNKELLEQLSQNEELLAASQGSVAGHHRSRVEAELALATMEVQFKKAQESQGSADELQQSNQNLIDEISEMRQKHDDKAAELTSLQDKFKERQASLIERDQRIAEMEGKLQAAEWKLSELEARATASPEAEADLTAKLQEAQRAVETLKKENEELSASLDKAAEALDGHHRARVELELQVATQSKKSGDHDKKIADQASQIAELEQRLANASVTSESDTNARVTELTNLLATAERSAKMFEENSDQQRVRISDLEQTLKNSKIRVAELEHEISTAAAGSHQMEDKLAGERQKIEAEKSRIKELETRIKELEEANKGALSDHQSLGDKIRIQDDQITSLQEETKRAEAEVTSLKTALDQKAAASETELASRVNELEQSVAKATADLAAERSKIESFKNSADVLKSQLEEEVERSRAAGSDAARLARDEAAVKSQLADQERTINDLQASLEASDRALVALRDEMARVEKEHKEAGASSAASEELAAQLKQTEEHLASLKEQSDKLAAEKATLETEKVAVEEAGGKFEKQAREIGAKLEAITVDHEQQINELQGKLEQGGTNRVKLQRELDELRADTVRYQKDNISAQKELEFLKSKIAEKEQSEQSLQDKVHQFKQDLSKLQSSSSSAKEQETALNRELAELKLTAVKQAKELKRIITDAKDKESLMESLTAQLDERQKRASKLEKQIKEQESDAAAWEMEVQFRNKRVEQLEGDLSKLKAEVQNSGGNDESLKGEVERLNRKLSDTDTKLRMLTNHNQNTWQRVKQTNAALRDLLTKGQISPQAVHTVKNIIAALESS